jgi:hypothetical protein
LLRWRRRRLQGDASWQDRDGDRNEREALGDGWQSEREESIAGFV